MYTYRVYSKIYILTHVNKLICGLLELQICHLAARENKIELLTTTPYSLTVASVEQFNEKSVCKKIETVLLRLFKFSTSKPYNIIGIHLNLTRRRITSSEAIRPSLPKMLFAALYNPRLAESSEHYKVHEFVKIRQGTASRLPQAFI